MVAGVAIANAARKLIGTPFHFGGRLPGIGLDCAGVIVLAHRECDLNIQDPGTYSKSAILRGWIRRFLEKTHDFVSQPRIGDVALFAITKRETLTHCAIVVAHNRIIHSLTGVGTTEAAIPAHWRETALFMRHREVLA